MREEKTSVCELTMYSKCTVYQQILTLRVDEEFFEDTILQISLEVYVCKLMNNREFTLAACMKHEDTADYG